MAKDILAKPDSFLDEFHRKPDDDKRSTTYCPGCGHGILHKLIGEAISDLGIVDRATIIAPVGCAAFMYYYYKSCGVQAAHGRAPAVGAGLARANDDTVVISYQGDGDLAAIGANNILQAANRGERMAVFFVNNAIYGMTGGQMAPTSHLNMRTTTSPRGRSAENDGYPLRMSEIIATLEAPIYVARSSLASTKEIMQTRAAIRKCLQAQMDRKGFTFLEILSQCPERWRVAPTKAGDWIREHLEPIFERKVFRDAIATAQPRAPKPAKVSSEELLSILGAQAGPDAVAPGGSQSARPEVRFRFAGFGGQGVLKLGVVVAQAGIAAGYQVSWLPSYGPEMRGGTANSCAVLRDGPIGSPLVDDPHVLMALNAPSLEKFLPSVRENGLVLYNSSVVSDAPPSAGSRRLYGAPALDLAVEAGDARAANMVMLGAYNQLAALFDESQIESAVRELFPKAVEPNLKALKAGAEYARAHFHA